MPERPNQYQNISLPAVAVIAAMDLGKLMHGQPMPQEALEDLTRRFAEVAGERTQQSLEVVEAFQAIKERKSDALQPLLAAYVVDALGVLQIGQKPSAARLREMYDFTHQLARAAGQQAMATKSRPVLKLVAAA